MILLAGPLKTLKAVVRELDRDPFLLWRILKPKNTGACKVGDFRGCRHRTESGAGLVFVDTQYMLRFFPA